MSEEAKKRLKDLAAKVREKTTPAGEPLLHARGLAMIEELAKELASEGGMPGLHVFRDNPQKFRLQRPRRNGEISIEWQRPIGAIVITTMLLGNVKGSRDYVWDEAQQRWRTLDSTSELWDDVSTTLIDVLYPEGK